MITTRRKITALLMGMIVLCMIAILSLIRTQPLAQALVDDIAWRVTGHLLLSSTAPTVTSAGTSPSVTASNGAATFIVNVGTGGTATTIVMAMPAAFAGWTCFANDITASAAAIAGVADRQMSSTTTAVTVQHYTISTGVALVYTASDLVRFNCAAF